MLLIFPCGCAAPAAAAPGRLWRAGAAQHKEVKDAPGSSGRLGHFLGSLAGVHLAPADPEVMAVVSQHLRADRATRNRAGSLWFLHSLGICPLPPVCSQPFGLKAARKRHFSHGGQAAAQHSVCSFAPLLSSNPCLWAWQPLCSRVAQMFGCSVSIAKPWPLPLAKSCLFPCTAATPATG